VIRVLVWSLLFLATLLIGLAVLLETAWVRDRVITSVLDATTDSWALERIDGRLPGDLAVHGLHLERQGLRIEVSRIALRPDPGRLLAGEVALAVLTLENLRIELPPTAASAADEPSALAFSTPIPVTIEAFLLDGLRVERGDQTLLEGLRVEARARLRDDRLRIDRLRIDSDRHGSLTGRGGLRITAALPWDAALAAVIEDTRIPEPFRALQLQVDASGDLGSATGTARAAAPAGAGALSARFDLHHAPGRPVPVTGHLHAELDAPMTLDAYGLDSARLYIEADGEQLSYRLDAVARGATPAPATLELGGTLEADQLRAETLRVRTGTSTLTGRASLALRPPHALTLGLSSEHLDLADLRSLDGWHSDLGGRLDVEGTLDSRRFQTRTLEVTGSWNDESVLLGGAVRLDLSERTPRIEADALEARVGENRFSGRLRYQDLVDIDLAIDARRLSQLCPPLSGRVIGQLRAQGATATPALSVDLTASDLALTGRDISASRVAVNGTLALGSGASTGVTASFQGLRAGASAPELDADLVLTGDWPRLDLSGDLRLGDMSLTAGLGADLATRRSGTLRRLELDAASAGRWHLDEPVQLARADGDRITFSGACLLRPVPGPGDEGSDRAARLCWADGDASAAGVELDARLEAIDLATLRPWLPTALELGGELDARLAVSGMGFSLDAGTSEAELRLRAVDGEIAFEERIDRFAVRVEGTPERVSIDAEFAGALVGRTTATGSLAPLSSAGVVDLDVRAALEDLSPLPFLIPELADTRGAAGGRLRIQGPLTDPDFTGTMTIAAGTGIPRLGIRADPVIAQISGSGREGTRLDVAATSNGGTLTLGGDLAWTRDAGLTFEGDVTGDTVQLLGLPELSVTASPRLALTLSPERITVRGGVEVPAAYAELRRLPQGNGSTLSDDVIIHDEAGVIRQTGRDLVVDLTLDLGSDVRFVAGSIEARLGGALRLTQSRAQGLRARGRIETLEGGVKGYGQTLRIRRGQLAFDGPIDNPGVDLIAVRQVEETEVGLQVAGTVRNLQTTLYSVPPMEDATILSMLVTGRRPGETSGSDANQIEAAALSLGIRQASPIIDELAGQLGIDEIGVESPLDQDSGSIVIGKEIGRNLYARYTYGLNSRIGGLVLEYRITDAWLVRSETGLTQSIDIMFRREFD
jgi:translocation and assembly module TamB